MNKIIHPKWIHENAPCSYRLFNTANGPSIQAYGLILPQMSDIDVEHYCSRINHLTSNGGLGQVGHRRRSIDLLFPSKAPGFYNEWASLMLKASCSSYTVTALSGCGSSGKSTFTAYEKVQWWLENPHERTLLVGSTTLTAMKTRIWAEIVKALREAEQYLNTRFKILNSGRPKIYWNREDDKHTIQAVPLAEGEYTNIQEELQGIHPTDGLSVIIDECPDVNPGVINVIPNWTSGNHSVKVTPIGNPKSRLDAFGQFLEPLDGWQSVDVNTVDSYKSVYGYVLIFDGLKSPAIIHPELSDPGQPLEFMFKQKNVDQYLAKFGYDKHPDFIRYVRGRPPEYEEGKTILNLALVRTKKVQSQAIFGGYKPKILYGSLDPAFTSGGDDCILRYAYYGETDDRQLVLDFMNEDLIFKVPIDQSIDTPVGYQILEFTKAKSTFLGCLPENFCIDCCGIGITLSDLFKKHWSTKIHFINSNAKPTNRPVRMGAEETCDQIYDRRVTELYFNAEEFVHGSHIRGLDKTSVDQLCARQWEYKSKKKYIETKKEYKKRMMNVGHGGGSPDLADAVTLILDVVKERGFVPGMIGEGNFMDSLNEEFDKQLDLINNQDSLFREQSFGGFGSFGGKQNY